MLSPDQLREFEGAGYLVIPGVVPEELLARADREIDGALTSEPFEPGALGHHSLFKPPSFLPRADAALRDSPALTIAEQLVAPHRLHHGLNHIQIAVNIPPFSHVPRGPHLDGHHGGQSRPTTFTLLAGIFLGDESSPHRGNVWVWPGSHRTHQRLFRERGPMVLLESFGHAGSLDPPVKFGSPVPVLGTRGDLFLAHFALGHNSGGNLTEVPRRMLYYRLRAEGHEGRWAETLLETLTEYAPVRAAAKRDE